jgi:uncharacterized protein
MEPTVVALLAAAVATLVGATVQGGLGFGMNLVTVPVLALVLPESLPVAVILLGIPISIVMVRHERLAVDRPGIVWVAAGRLPGSAVGAWVVAVVSVQVLQRLIGLLVLAFVVASAVAPAIPVRRSTQAAAGAVAGVTGTAAGIGGPPVALLYQHHPGPAMRSTLAASFFIGTVLSLGALGLAGAVRAPQVALGLGLAPFVIVGTRLGRRFHALLDRGWLRVAVLGFSALSALVVLVDSLA